MVSHSEFAWHGLAISHRTVLTGAVLSPEWALVRVRRALDEHRGTATGIPSSGDLKFDEPVASVSLTGAWFPSIVSGDVRAEGVPDGVAVTATADLTVLLVALLISLVGVPAFFVYADLTGIALFPIWLGLVPLAAAFHLWQITRVLRMMTTAGTAL